MSDEPLENLAQLLGTYFHQDWGLESADAEGVLRSFVAGESAATVRRVCDEIDRLLSRGLSEEQLRSVVYGDMGSCYDPAADGMIAEEWLREVQSFMRDHSHGQ